jgi:hypothetical protein
MQTTRRGQSTKHKAPEAQNTKQILSIVFYSPCTLVRIYLLADQPQATYVMYDVRRIAFELGIEFCSPCATIIYDKKQKVRGAASTGPRARGIGHGH